LSRLHFLSAKVQGNRDFQDRHPLEAEWHGAIEITKACLSRSPLSAAHSRTFSSSFCVTRCLPDFDTSLNVMIMPYRRCGEVLILLRSQRDGEYQCNLEYGHVEASRRDWSKARCLLFSLPRLSSYRCLVMQPDFGDVLQKRC